MNDRLFAISVLAAAALGLVPVASAQTGEPQSSPDTVERSQNAPGLGLDGRPQDEPFYFGLNYRGIAADDQPSDPKWFQRDGIDSPYDIDPRKQLHLPQPEPVLKFRLR